MLKIAKIITVLFLSNLYFSSYAGENAKKAPEETLMEQVWSENLIGIEKKLENTSKNDLSHARCRMGYTILHHAAVMANIPMLELIVKNWIQHGLNLDELAGRKGSTPAHSAINLLSKKTPEVLRVLKKSGATCDIQRGIDKKTPLQIVEMEIEARNTKLSGAQVNEDQREQLQSEIEILEESKQVLKSEYK